MDENFIKLLLTVHKDLPQEGPGSKESTLRALSMIKDLPPSPSILDIGCGPGRQTIDLANNTNGSIIAIDIFDQYLDQLKEKVKTEKLKERVHVLNCSMEDLKFKPQQFDLIWSEGAIYLMGFEKGLTSWKKFLKPGGYIAVTEAVWLRSDPPEDLKKFWMEGYPGIQTVQVNIPIIEKCGYKLTGHFTLPESDWWQYYKPLQKRINHLKHNASPELLEHLKWEEIEFDYYKKYSKYYGYEFYVMRL